MPECCKLHEQRRGRCGASPECFSPLHASFHNGQLSSDGLPLHLNSVFSFLHSSYAQHPSSGILGFRIWGCSPGGSKTRSKSRIFRVSRGGRKTPPKTPKIPPREGGWRYTKQCKFWRVSSVLIQGDSAGIRVRGVFLTPPGGVFRPPLPGWHTLDMTPKSAVFRVSGGIFDPPGRPPSQG